MQQRRADDRQASFRIPHVIMISAFCSVLAALSVWCLSLEIKKADRSEIIGSQYRQVLDSKLEDMQIELRYIRRRLDDHMMKKDP